MQNRGGMNAFEDIPQQNNHNMTYQYEGSAALMMDGGNSKMNPHNTKNGNMGFAQNNNSMIMNNSGYQMPPPMM